MILLIFFFFFFQAEDGIRDKLVTGVQTCALPIYLDDVVILGARCAAGTGRRDHGPVEAAATPARAIEPEDEWHVVEAGVWSGAAVVDVADHDQLGDTVTIDIGDDGGAVVEAGTVVDAAVGVATQVHGLVDVDTDLAPELARGGDGGHREVGAVSVEGVEVVPAGDEQLLEAVAVHVCDGHVLVPHAEAVAGLAVVAGPPARAGGAGGRQDV